MMIKFKRNLAPKYWKNMTAWKKNTIKLFRGEIYLSN